MKKFYYLAWLGLATLTAFSQTTVSTDSIVRTDPLNESSSSSLYPPYNGPDTTQKKLVFWVHGLAGNTHSWNRVASVTESQASLTVPGYPVRLTEGYVLDYSSEENQNILDVGRYANRAFENWRKPSPRTDTLPIEDNFVIAHSQGGILARAIRFQNLTDTTSMPSQFGGIATFGTPHGGAPIVTTSSDTVLAVQKWIGDGCGVLSAAEIQTFVSTIWWLDPLISVDYIRQLTSQSCSGLERIVLPKLVASIRADISNGYAPGADPLDSLTRIASLDTIPVVTFYGVEQEPVFWRVLHSMTFTQDASQPGSIVYNDPFGLNDDARMGNYVNSRIAQYSMLEKFWRRRGKFFSSIQLGNWGARNKAELYKDARYWLGGANMAWKRFIGARRDSAFQDGYLCYCDYALIPTWVSDPSYCVSQTNVPCTVIPHESHYIVEEASDGVVPKSSQVDYPGAIEWPMVNTNHMQERNCLETKNRLNELFAGRHGLKFRLYEK